MTSTITSSVTWCHYIISHVTPITSSVTWYNYIISHVTPLHHQSRDIITHQSRDNITLSVTWHQSHHQSHDTITSSVTWHNYTNCNCWKMNLCTVDLSYPQTFIRQSLVLQVQFHCTQWIHCARKKGWEKRQLTATFLSVCPYKYIISLIEYPRAGGFYFVHVIFPPSIHW